MLTWPGQEAILLQSSEAAICNHCVLFAYQVFDAEGQLPVASLHESPSRMDDENDELAVTSTRLRKVPDK
ncbi:MAG: hypothetical protein HY744_04065 [Deltaproteobacteria bacterium]|nr:hypothetical protein [Deltaproteobacteria bacterium]